MNCTPLAILTGFILFLEEFLESSVGFSHLSNNKTMYYQQVFNCHCCYITLLLVSHRIFIKNIKQVSKWSLQMREMDSRLLAMLRDVEITSMTYVDSHHT